MIIIYYIINNSVNKNKKESQNPALSRTTTQLFPLSVKKAVLQSFQTLLDVNKKRTTRHVTLAFSASGAQHS